MFDNKFYRNIKKPSITPPPVVFKIIWPALYLMMFISAIIIISKESGILKKTALLTFCIQLFLNIIWSPVFFVMKKIKSALIIAIIMTVFTGITIYMFSKISITAGRLLIPYFLWLIFACFLNYKFLKLNKDIKKRNS